MTGTSYRIKKTKKYQQKVMYNKLFVPLHH